MARARLPQSLARRIRTKHSLEAHCPPSPPQCRRAWLCAGLGVCQNAELCTATGACAWPCGLPPQEQDDPLSTSAATDLYRPQCECRASGQSGARSTNAGSRATPSVSEGTTTTAAQPALPHGKPVSSEVGMASWYGPPYANRKGADGTVYDQNAMTAAHRTLPMGSIVRVTNLSNDQSVVVRITDRGPFVGDRIIDLSLAAAKETGVYRAGVAKVRVEAYAPPVHPGVDPAGRWCVQIGAFLDEADAIQAEERPYAPLLDGQGDRVRRAHRPLGAHQPAERRQDNSQPDRGEHPHPRRPARSRISSASTRAWTRGSLPRACAADGSSAGGG